MLMDYEGSSEHDRLEHYSLKLLVYEALSEHGSSEHDRYARHLHRKKNSKKKLMFAARCKRAQQRGGGGDLASTPVARAISTLRKTLEVLVACM